MINHNIHHSDFEILCINDMAANGLGIREPLTIDGKIHRYSIDNKKYGKDGWYVVYDYDLSEGISGFICIYGSWRTGVKYRFHKCNNGGHSLTSAQQIQFKEVIKTRQKDAEQQIAAKQAEAAENATKIWDSSADSPESEAYTRYARSKGITPIGVKFGLFYDRYAAMIIPVKNVHGQIRSLQYIFTDDQGKSQKSFLSGGEKKGNFHVIGSIQDQSIVYITEGYATGMSVHMATKSPVVVAFDAGNIEHVLGNLKDQFTDSKFVIAGDSDSNEIGSKKAFKAASRFGGYVVFPTFPKDRSVDEDGQKYTDFNDLHKVSGLDEVHNQLQHAVAVQSEAEKLQQLALSFSSEQDPCADFDITMLPNELYRYIGSLCETTQAHPIMITSSVLATISAFVGQRAIIPKGEYFQELSPNLWLLNIAESGHHKTTAMKLGAELAFDQQAKVSKVIQQIDDELKTCKDNERKQELMKQRLDESRKDVILSTRVTGEGLIKHLSEGHGGAMYASEFGALLQNLDKSHNNDLKGILTDLFDVPSSWRNLTKTQGDHTIIKPFITIFGVSPLPFLQKTLEEDDVANGFFARFLILALPSSNAIPIGLPSYSDHVRGEAKKRFEKVMQRILTEIQYGREYRLSEGARSFFDHKKTHKGDYEGWHQKIYRMVQECDEKTQEILAPYPRRWSPYLLKLAVFMQLFEDSTSEEIDIPAMCSALAFLLPAIKSTIFLFSGPLGESKHQQACEKILKWIAKRIAKKGGKPVLRQELLQSKQLDGGYMSYDYVLKTLIEQGKIVFIQKERSNESLYSLADSTVESDCR